MTAVATFFPLPQDHGDAIRRMLLLDALHELTDLTVLAVRRPETTRADVLALHARLDGARVLDHAPWQDELGSTSSKLLRSARGLATGTPPWVYRQWSGALARTRQPAPPDVLVLIGEPAGPYARLLPAERTIWDKSNVLAASDLDTLRSLGSARGRAQALATLPLSAAFERRVLRHVDEVWVSSEQQRALLSAHYGRAGAVLGSIVEPGPVAPGVDVRSRTLLWLSTLSYRPNWEGLLAVLDAVAPGLAELGWTLRVVGAGATAAQEQQLRSYGVVDFRGYVADLPAACDGVAAAVVPVWSGAGVKLKTLTLMRLGVPVIATPVALEGIPHDAAAAVVSTPADFLTALVATSAAELAEARERALAMLPRHFGVAAFTGTVARLLDEGPSGSAARQETNRTS